jgi:hypothetical protein
MATSMERSRPVTYDTFWAVFLHQEASLVGTWRLMADSSFYRALRYKTVAVFAVLSLLLTVAFPTLASAMTGYVIRTNAYVKDAPHEDGNFVRFTEFEAVAYVVHDAWRVNMTGSLLVPYGPVNRTGKCLHLAEPSRPPGASDTIVVVGREPLVALMSKESGILSFEPCYAAESNIEQMGCELTRFVARCEYRFYFFPLYGSFRLG